MNYLDLMPKFMGLPYYPNGLPIPAEDVAVGGESILEISERFLAQPYEDHNAAQIQDAEKLKAYINYRINAPGYAGEELKQIRQINFAEYTIAELMFKCLECGIDDLFKG